MFEVSCREGMKNLNFPHNEKLTSMKKFLLFLIFTSCFFPYAATAQDKKDTTQPDKNKELLVVEAACGQCRFDLPGEGCNLAVRIKGKAYFVDGTDIDSHGDAHAQDGFCNAIRKAKVQGRIVSNRFQATYFRLLADASAKKENEK